MINAYKNASIVNISNKNISDELDCIELKRLSQLDCNNNRITKLLNLNPNINFITCVNNKITSLDNLPKQLKYLNCSSNCLTSLDFLPVKIKTLICNRNNLIHLNNLPDGLTKLSCFDNKTLSCLDNLPIGLIELDCSYCTKLTNLNFLPESLKILAFNGCGINICLENLPNSLEQIQIFDFDNQIIKKQANKHIWTKKSNMLIRNETLKKINNPITFNPVEYDEESDEDFDDYNEFEYCDSSAFLIMDYNVWEKYYAKQNYSKYNYLKRQEIEDQEYNRFCIGQIMDADF